MSKKKYWFCPPAREKAETPTCCATSLFLEQKKLDTLWRGYS